MLKFTRYFFFIFLLTTVFPLVALFFWMNHQMKVIEAQGIDRFLSIGAKQAESSVKQYLKMTENENLERYQNLGTSSPAKHQLKELFADKRIEFIYTENIKKVSSEYALIKDKHSSRQDVFTVTSIPVWNSSIKGIKITEPANFSKIELKGPFVTELYLGNHLNKNTFITSISNPVNPHQIRLTKKYPVQIQQKEMSKGIPKNKSIKYTLTHIKNNQNQTVATILIKAQLRPPGPIPPHLLENILSIMILMTGLLTSIIIALYVKKTFITPLLELTSASQEVKNGNLTKQLSTDNIRQEHIISTFNNFNSMVNGLREKEELRHSFVTNLTHDLKTPLIAQERALELISFKFKDLNLKEEYNLAKNLEKNNRHLLRMVNLILESYQFDNQKLHLVFEECDLKTLIDECYEKIKPIANEKCIIFNNNIFEDTTKPMLDKATMERVFINLLSNAVENINEGQEITVSSDTKEHILQIIIKDNGPGISEAELQHIFDRYYSGKSFDRKLGSGLGLDVCKKLLELNKCTIYAESKIEEYTKFIINIPI